MKGTEKEIFVGDVIQSDTTEEIEDGHTKYRHLDTLVCDETIPILLESGIIEEKEVRDEYEGLDFCFSNTDCLLEDMLKSQESLENKIDQLTHLVQHLVELTSSVLGKDARKKSGK